MRIVVYIPSDVIKKGLKQLYYRKVCDQFDPIGDPADKLLGYLLDVINIQNRATGELDQEKTDG